LKSKIALVFGLSVSCAFVLLILIQYPIYEQMILEDENYVYEKMNENSANFSKSIYLLGSSHILTLNNTHIKKIINEKFPNYDFVNLGKNGDRPSKRINDIELILSEQPSIVIYGVGFRDFSSLRSSTDLISKEPENILPNPKNVISELFFSLDINLGNNFGFLESPKIISLQAIRKELGIKLIETNEKLRQSDLIKSSEELKNLIKIDPPIYEIPSFKTNKDAKSLIEIIQKLKQNNIKIILFTTPHSKFYLNSISENQLDNFKTIIDELEKSYDVQIFYLHDKYANLEIWRDNEHIAENKNTIIYSNDIANIIKNTIEP